MKLAHIAVVTPGRCGLYETTRDLTAALRKAGVDSRLVDPTRAKNKFHPDSPGDRGVPFADEDWAMKADALVNHSGLGGRLEKSPQPIIHMAHGRPRSSFLMEKNGNTPVFSYHYHKNKDPRFKAVVTFWPEHKPYLNVMLPDKPVRSITAPVDLERWNPVGARGYNFGGHGGDINVAISDAWREDIDPFEAVMCFALWARTQEKTAKLHIYGNNRDRRGWDAIFKRIREDGHMGERRGWVQGLDNVYRVADMVITPHRINTRTVREAMACGCPVARVWDIHRDQTRLTFALSANRDEIRKQAESEFSPQKSAREFIDVVQEYVT